MAKAVGIHIDQRHFRLVALDGSPKKHKVTAVAEGVVEPGDDPVSVVASTLKRVAKKNKLSAEEVSLVVDSGLAAFRSLTLPFDDRTKIEEVIRFEIESDLPQWDIDDVIVDFLVTDSKPGVESNLLVTALPKARLAQQLNACERAGLEANDAELDGSALFNAAHHGGLLSEDSAAVLVHVGDATTSVVVADGGRLVSMRAIRAGAIPHRAPVAQVDSDPEESEAEFLGEEEPAAQPEATVSPDAAYTSSDDSLAQTVQRIRREIARTISAAQTTNPIEGVYVCGALPAGLTSEPIAHLEVHLLEVFPADDADLGGADPSSLTVAYGCALRQLGASHLQPHLRRDDLRYTGKFERLELPLAVFSLLLFTFLSVKLITINKEFQWRETWSKDPAAVHQKGDMQIWLQASNNWMFPDPDGANGPYAGRLENPPEHIEAYARRAERDEIEDRTKYEQMQRIYKLLFDEVNTLKKDLGMSQGQAVEGIPQPQSALHGTTLVLDLMAASTETIGRTAIRGITADYVAGRSSDDDNVMVKIDLDFYAENSVEATRHYNDFRTLLQEQVWCNEVERKTVTPFESGDGLSVDGLVIRIDVSKALQEEQA